MKKTLVHKIIAEEEKALNEMLRIAGKCQLKTGRPLKVISEIEDRLCYASYSNTTTEILKCAAKNAVKRNNFSTVEDFINWAEDILFMEYNRLEEKK